MDFLAAFGIETMVIAIVGALIAAVHSTIMALVFEYPKRYAEVNSAADVLKTHDTERYVDLRRRLTNQTQCLLVLASEGVTPREKKQLACVVDGVSLVDAVRVVLVDVRGSVVFPPRATETWDLAFADPTNPQRLMDLVSQLVTFAERHGSEEVQG